MSRSSPSKARGHNPTEIEVRSEVVDCLLQNHGHMIECVRRECPGTRVECFEQSNLLVFCGKPSGKKRAMELMYRILSRYRFDLSTLRRAARDLGKDLEIEKYIRDGQELQRVKEETKKENNLLKNTINELRNANDELKNIKDELETANDGLENDNDELKNDNDELKNDNDELKQELNLVNFPSSTLQAALNILKLKF